MLALALNFTNFSIPVYIDNILEKLTAPFTVLALLTIGMQINLSIDRKFINMMLLGQFFKLVLSPLTIYILLWQVVGIDNTIAKVCLLGAGIGSMNSISIIAAQMGLNPRLAVLMPALSIPLSVPLLFLIDYLV